MTDEAHFHSSGCDNEQNFRYWAEENPQQLHPRPLHRARVTVWCGVANFGVKGPYLTTFNDQSFCNNKLEIKIKFHCFIYF
jgi:hypothetical protein